MNVTTITKQLEKEYGKPRIMLTYGNTMQLLVAVILSAQCTDTRVNMVTKELFTKYKTAKDFATADVDTFKQEIRSCGFYNMKAKSIIGAAKIIVAKYSGTVPSSMHELLQLPGVARKTANIVLSNAYGIHSGVAVDTHVRRLCYRMGLTTNTDPNKIEQELMKIVPKKEWNTITYLLIEHGRAVCKAPTPICSSCVLQDICPKKGVGKQK